MSDWTIEELQRWDEKIREKVAEFGLDCYRQEFELCDHHAMLGYMAYHGMPAHYPHWSYGKSFEKTKTLYDYGVTGLPYELVINSDPCLAYLMTDNTLTLQILTIAHVYGHNDFFKNNSAFVGLVDPKTGKRLGGTRASDTIGNFKARADRVRDYIEDPSIGADAVEELLDAAHALAFLVGKRPYEDRPTLKRRHEASVRSEETEQPYADLQARKQEEESEFKYPSAEYPEQWVLAFIRDNHPDLKDWQRDVLDIVIAQTSYFLPQMETKIMNEGWASYWHHRILNSLDLPADIQLEFIKNHNQVVCPHPHSINPYHVGFWMWHYLLSGLKAIRTKNHKLFRGTYQKQPMTEREVEFFTRLGGADDPRGFMFEVRGSDTDPAFVRRFLTRELMEALGLYSYAPEGDKYVVDHTPDEGAEELKRKLISQIGLNGQPRIVITDADYNRRRELYLVHDHDGRDLHLGYAERTLQHLYTLWGRRVLLETQVNGKPTRLAFDEEGFDARLIT